MAVDPGLIDVVTAAQTFSDIARYEYQNRQYLVGIGQDRDMVGTSLQIPVIDRVEMKDRGFTSGDLPITNISSRAVTIEPNDFVLKSAIGDSNQTLFAYDKVDAFSRAHIKAAARQVDAVKIAAVVAGTYSVPLRNFIPKNTATTPLTTTTGLAVTQLIEAQTLLEDNGYDMRDKMYLVGNVIAIKNLFNENRFTDWDFQPARPVSLDPIEQFDMLLGYSVRKLGSQGKNIITISGAQDTTAVYAIAGEAIENGYNKRLHSAVVNEPFNLRTAIVTGLTMGTAIVHPTGIIKIECDQIPTTPA